MSEWVTGLISQLGYVGIALLMLLENVFPPVPSELIVPLAGFSAGKGELHLAGVVAAATAGSVLGALVWYALGRWLGEGRSRRWVERHGRWLGMSPADLERAEAWFGRHAGWAVLGGRLVPAVRTLISVPAGIFRMPLGRFLLFTTLGSAGWATLLALAGFVLGSRYGQVERYLGPVSTGIVGVLVAGYLYRVLTFRRRPHGRAREPRPSAPASAEG
jgi:membrane protein DedA with SNARE-associated domain